MIHCRNIFKKDWATPLPDRTILNVDLVICLQKKKVHVAAVGVGQYEDFQGELEQNAGPDHVHTADNYDKLSNLFSEILEESCSK